MSWRRVLEEIPLVAILRGLAPANAVSIAGALHEAGIVCLEVPLNSPEPLRSIEAIRKAFDSRLYVGAGTVLTLGEVRNVATAGAQFVVSPNTDVDVITATKERGLESMPGFFTPTEALVAARAGADALKLFPAESSSPAHVKALKAVLPAPPIFAVGGITGETMHAWSDAGAAGFGIGGSLYRPGDKPDVVRARATKLVAAYRALRK